MKSSTETLISEQKAALRSEVKLRLRRISAEQRRTASEQAFVRLEGQPAWVDAPAIIFFVPRADEIDVGPWLGAALKLGKRVALPGFELETESYIFRELRDEVKDIIPGKYGIAEPSRDCARLMVKPLDLILVPGVAFDLQGHRLGRGKGHYDQLLMNMDGIKCGVAFDEQIFSQVPAEPHDERLTCILTPTRWIPVAESSRVVA
jgi:5-formyltetrahydrofolate cyclo-ligase